MMRDEFGGQPVIYTDDDGVKHAARIHDTMPGKHGYTGIVLTDTETEEFLFVEDWQIEDV